LAYIDALEVQNPSDVQLYDPAAARGQYLALCSQLGREGVNCIDPQHVDKVLGTIYFPSTHVPSLGLQSSSAEDEEDMVMRVWTREKTLFRGVVKHFPSPAAIVPLPFVAMLFLVCCGVWTLSKSVGKKNTPKQFNNAMLIVGGRDGMGGRDAY